MKIKILIRLAVAALLFEGPLFSMELSSDTDEETQPDIELSVGSFFTSQVVGARELLSYGKRAGEDLLSMVRADKADELTSQSNLEKQLA